MSPLLLISLLILVAAVFSYINTRFFKLPTTIGLMCISFVLSLIVIALGNFSEGFHSYIKEIVKNIDFSQALLNVMLGFLLFSGSLHVNLKQLKEHRTAVFSFSTLSVALSTFFFGGLMWFVFRIFNSPVEFIYCLWFGALVSPTDPIAVIGILKKSNMPAAIETTINGESLFNDGIGIVFFITIGRIITIGLDHVTFLSVSVLFFREVIGGLILGIALAYTAYYFIRKIDHYQTEVLISLALVMMCGVVASSLQVSGPLAVIAVGLILGNKISKTAMSEVSEDYLNKFWELIDDFMNSILFVLIGLQMVLMPFIFNYLVIGTIAILLLLICRFFSLSIPVLFLKNKTLFNRKTVVLMTWGGLRGGLSLALTLSLPENPYKEIIVSITYIIVIFSILVQGLSTGMLVKKLYK
jgi:CPA1 family monovalent cation:H+ antiporter